MNEREDIVMDILEIMKERHSVRQHKNQAIEPSKREEISSLINDVNAESKLSIQAFSMNRNVLIPLWLIMENLKM